MKISKKHINLIAVIAILFILLVATQVEVGTNKGDGELTAMEATSSFMVLEEGMDMAASKTSSFGIMPPGEPELLTDDGATEKKVIQTGTLNVQVENVEASSNAITAGVDALGGFVSESDFGEIGDGSRRGSMTLRVPSKEFKSAIELVKNNTLVVENESTNANDVTERYVDLSARLKNAQATEQAYTQILQKAVSVQDILSVQQALGNIRGQIESLQGQIQYLDNQADMSTIRVIMAEEARVVNPPKTFRPGASVNEAINAVITIAHMAVTAIIWIVIVGAGVGIPLLLLYWIIKRLMRLRK